MVYYLHKRYKVETAKTIRKQSKGKKLRKNLSEGWKNVGGVFYYYSLAYIPEIICSQIISRHYNNSLADHFEIEKTRELGIRKYFWCTFYQDVEADYVKGYDICLALNAVHNMLYGDI